MKRSRLSRRLEKQTKKNLFISLLGIVVILFLLTKFGLPLLINFSLFLSGAKNTNEPTQKNSSQFIQAPVLNPLIEATNSAKLTISGQATPKITISLYLNDEIIDKISTKDNGTFTFNDVELLKGENTIKVKAVTQDKKESDFSRSYIVIYKNTPPSLTIDSPNDGQSFLKDENSIKVLGKTDTGSKVTINDYWAIVDGDGNFSYNLQVQNGENTIEVVAVDEAGNKTEKEIKVTYSP